MPADTQPDRLALVFTDVEGSTQLWQLDEDAFSWALLEHDALVRESLGRHGGEEVKHTGDGFFLAFEETLGAARFAVELQQTLAAHDWPAMLGQLRIRIGIHWGPVRRHQQDYRGAAVSLAARVCGHGAGGQIVLSSDAADALAPDLDIAGRLHPLGTAQLDGIQGLTELFELQLEPVPLVATPTAAAAAEEPAPDFDDVLLLEDGELWAGARNALREGHHRVALAHLRVLAERHPDTPAVLASLGVAFGTAHQHEAAEQCLRRAVALQPGNAGVWYNLARIYGKLGRRDKITWALTQALAADPHHPKALAAARKYGLR